MDNHRLSGGTWTSFYVQVEADICWPNLVTAIQMSVLISEWYLILNYLLFSFRSKDDTLETEEFKNFFLQSSGKSVWVRTQLSEHVIFLFVQYLCSAFFIQLTISYWIYLQIRSIYPFWACVGLLSCSECDARFSQFLPICLTWVVNVFMYLRPVQTS